uniref:ShKT domain-containing protein n=1 Tax=Panagrellus redivivus TaxID=6233 RepID=A0A7E4VWY0_PANRE
MPSFFVSGCRGEFHGNERTPHCSNRSDKHVPIGGLQRAPSIFLRRRTLLADDEMFFALAARSSVVVVREASKSADCPVTNFHCQAMIAFSTFLKLLFVACLFGGSYGALSEKGNDNAYKLLRIYPKSMEEVNFLHELYKASTEFEFDFWKAPTAVGAFVDLMVGPELAGPTQKLLAEHNIEFRVTVEDVQKRIVEKETPNTSHNTGLSPAALANLNPLLRSFFTKRVKDAPYTSRNRAKYRFGEYHSYDEMIQWMNEIERNYPHMAKVFSIGTTNENRPIKGIQIGNPINAGKSKRAVWIDGGIHAREWAAVHTALYFIEQLIAGYDTDPQVRGYVDTLNFYIVPVANPDGFEYSRSDVTPQTRFWRKNRSNIKCAKDRWHRDRCCGGVDLNRNFDFHFGETGSSQDTCSDIYQGSGAFSEPESRAIRDKLLSPELYGNVDAFITLHTYSQMWIHPYNHERRAFPEDINDLQDVGRRGVEAIESMYGTKFRFGTGADILYPSAGGSDDWAKAKANIKYVYLLELRPGEEQWDGFLLDRKQLIPTGRETWEGVKVVLDAVMARVRRGPVAITTPSTPPPTTTTPATTTRAPTTTTTTPQPTTTTAAVTWTRRARPGPVFRFPQQQTVQQPLLRDRLNSARQQQLQARREYEFRLSQQREMERRRQQAQLAHQLRQQAELSAATPQICSDKSRWCRSWIQTNPNICNTSTIYMRKDCAFSCGFC